VFRSAALILLAILVAGCSQMSAFQTSGLSGIETSRIQTDRTGTVMVTGGHAFAPPAFYEFCSREPALCSTSGKTRTVELTPAREAELNRVNDIVNRRVRERSDSGRGDDWRLPGREGDCEDFAIAKKAELLKRGWPASTLLLTVATLGGEGHTVLTVRTSKGDLVLDNRTGAIKDWSRTPYRYFARQSQGATGNWTRIGAASLPVS
jgi:predicted transglutaminase-like cysteine proteinase